MYPEPNVYDPWFGPRGRVVVSLIVGLGCTLAGYPWWCTLLFSSVFSMPSWDERIRQ